MAASAIISLLPPPSVVRVGVGVLVKDPSDPHKVFCGIRKGGLGEGTLALPGGHLEMMESWEDCAYREVMEECHLKLHKTTIRLGHVTNDPMPNEQRHYVTIFMLAQCQATIPVQTPQNREPEKCEGWKSFTWEELQALQPHGKLFGPLDRLVQESPKIVTDFVNS
jgi:8-oxo-dGTP diphosphatase